MNATDNQRQSAYKRVSQLRGFYMHLASYLLINVTLLIPYFILDIAPIFWQRCFTIMIGVAGLGVLGHAMWVFGPKFILPSKWENRKIKQFEDESEG
jgi:2TM domain